MSAGHTMVRLPLCLSLGAGIMRPSAEACSALTPAVLRRRASTAVRQQHLSAAAAQLKLLFKLACKQCKLSNVNASRVCAVCADYCDTYLTHDSVSAHTVLPACGPVGRGASSPLRTSPVRRVPRLRAPAVKRVCARAAGRAEAAQHRLQAQGALLRAGAQRPRGGSRPPRARTA